MMQVPFVLPLVAVAWLFDLKWRAARPASNPWLFNGVQILLVMWSALALVCLYIAIHAGLLWIPDVQVAGGGSSDHYLRWFVDRVSGAAPRPVWVSFPEWTWRVGMLLWPLWLAGSALAARCVALLDRRRLVQAPAQPAPRKRAGRGRTDASPAEAEPAPEPPPEE